MSAYLAPRPPASREEGDGSREGDSGRGDETSRADEGSAAGAAVVWRGARFDGRGASLKERTDLGAEVASTPELADLHAELQRRSAERWRLVGAVVRRGERRVTLTFCRPSFADGEE